MAVTLAEVLLVMRCTSNISQMSSHFEVLRDFERPLESLENCV